MAIQTLDVYGERAETVKDNESVVVQIVDVNGSVRLEARVWVDSDRYNGWAKTAISFADPGEAEKFSDAFYTALQDFQSRPASPKANGSSAPASTKPVVGRGKAASRTTRPKVAAAN